MLLNVSTAEVKDEIGSGKIEEISSDAPTTEARDEVKSEARSAKKINRNLAFLLISVLAIGIVILGIFLFQKSGNLDELSSKLDRSRQALTQSQTQLAASQQDVEGLRTQLTQAQQEVEALQAEVNELKPLTPSGPFVYSGELSGNDMISFPIELKQSETVEGTITGGLGGLAVYIQDSEGAIVEDLGRVFYSSFTFIAQTSGTYALVIKGPSGLASKYVVDYTVYRRQ
jgi:predicted RNase H-like nuclease (RuvC/YqgF family)